MQFQVTSNGKKVYPAQFKQQVLAELDQGKTAAELGREHQIPMQNILKWKKQRAKIENSTYGASQIEQGVPISEYKKILEENKQLKKSLANMTVDRDILKEAVASATKKKWI